LPLVLAVLVPAAQAATGDELEEAKPLEAPVATAPAAEHAIDRPYRYRGYALGEWANLIPDSSQLKTRDQSLAEVNGSGSVSFQTGFQLFGDLTGTYRFRIEDGDLLLNQLGVRYRRGPWEGLAGKERARKSPGMVLSPSDFLFPNDSLPGLREQREGVWMARGSWLAPGHSVDVIYAPNLVVNDQGLPDDDETRRAAALRYFRQSSAFDAGANLATIDGDPAAGFWGQTYLFKTTKIYLDAAWRDTDQVLNRTVHDASKALAGVSYEGYSHGTFRLEVYANNRGLEGTVTAAPAAAGASDPFNNIFYRRGYGIASVQLTDLWRESAFTLNHIRAFEYSEWVWVARYELPLTAHQAVGTTVARFHGLATTPDATLATLDWKYTF
jgi:hypothetical protein